MSSGTAQAQVSKADKEALEDNGALLWPFWRREGPERMAPALAGGE